MATPKQLLGQRGELLTITHCGCPRCKRKRSLRRLPSNFKCADIICDFCGYLAQVKTATVRDASKLPALVPGAAWNVQKERMEAGVYFPLFLVLFESPRRYSIHYLSADLQSAALFIPRRALSDRAKRAGWTGFIYDLRTIPRGAMVRVFSCGLPR